MMSRRYLHTLKRFVRRSAGPLLGVWLVVYAIERLVLEYVLDSHRQVAGVWGLLTSWQANELPIGTFLGLIFVIALTWGFRTALYKSSYKLMRGRKRRLSAGEIIVDATSRMPGVFATEGLLGVIYFGVLAICLIINPPIFFFVEFPLAVAFSPVMYLVVARHYSVGRALVKALKMWREHWVLMFTVQGVLVLMGVAVSQALQGSQAFHGRALLLLLGLQYARWVAQTALFLTLDEKRVREE